MKKEIIQTWHFPHPPEVIWEYLTTPELLAQWLMKNDFKAEVGHKFQFNAEPRVKVGFDGIIYCEVLKIIPNQFLSYSWKGGPGKGKITLDSVVSWTLTAKDGGTELLLEHKGFKGVGNFITYLIMNKGWAVKVKGRLTDLLKTIDHEA
ncbi:SRPBCC family protein [Fulvivirga ligni]|uniref:SRPBCC family protein n=1 Tax=Fulvivirga ligni TaxID=2904246 RepID=UPI001F1B4AE8|nr:SRPBCC domain-containing protein [Fulvivirga ligni]UII21007.1 SRPBCC domain-containing protein [Fulvivirga ligni]